MVDRRSKMIDNDKLVYFCTTCNRRFVGDLNTNILVCPICKNESSDKNKPLLVIDNTFIVRK